MTISSDLFKRAQQHIPGGVNSPVRAGLELLCEAKQKLHIPVVAIGGITPENGAHLLAAGADALAVIEGVFGQVDISAAAQRYTRLFHP